MQQAVRFLITGGVGFLVDSGGTLLLVEMDIQLPIAKLVSFLVAVSVTFYINREWTFAKAGTNRVIDRQYTKYFLGQGVGAAINFCTFFALLFVFPALNSILLLPLAIASLAAMSFNFMFAKTRVFG